MMREHSVLTHVMLCRKVCLYMMREHSVPTHVMLCRIGLSVFDERTLGTLSCHVVPYRSENIVLHRMLMHDLQWNLLLLRLSASSIEVNGAVAIVWLRKVG